MVLTGQKDRNSTKPKYTRPILASLSYGGSPTYFGFARGPITPPGPAMARPGRKELNSKNNSNQKLSRSHTKMTYSYIQQIYSRPFGYVSDAGSPRFFWLREGVQITPPSPEMARPGRRDYNQTKTKKKHPTNENSMLVQAPTPHSYIMHRTF